MVPGKASVAMEKRENGENLEGRKERVKGHRR